MSQQKRIAFVIPLDTSRHLQFAENLGDLKSEFSDVFVILSRSSDLALVGPLLDSRCKILVMTDWITEDAIIICERRRGMATFKKWSALRRLLDSYDAANLYSHCICCDSELRVIHPIDEKFVDSLPKQFLFVGDHLSPHTSYDGYRYILNCALAAAPCSVETQSRPGGCVGQLMSWWSGVPVYAVDSLSEFLSAAGADDPMALAKSLKWEIFDHSVYQHYVVSHRLHDSEFICLSHYLKTPTGWSLDDVATPQAIAAAEAIGFATLWASQKTLNRLPFLRDRIYIEYHLDRQK